MPDDGSTNQSKCYLLISYLLKILGRARKEEKLTIMREQPLSSTIIFTLLP